MEEEWKIEDYLHREISFTENVDMDNFCRNLFVSTEKSEVTYGSFCLNLTGGDALNRL